MVQNLNPLPEKITFFLFFSPNLIGPILARLDTLQFGQVAPGVPGSTRRWSREGEDRAMGTALPMGSLSPALNWKRVIQISNMFLSYKRRGSRLTDTHMTASEHTDDENARVCSGTLGFKDWFGTGALDFYLILLMNQLSCSICAKQRLFCAILYLRKLSQQKVNRKLCVPVNPSLFSQKSKENDQEKLPMDLHYFSTGVAGSSTYHFSMYRQTL